MLVNLTLNNHMWLVATILDSVATVSIRNAPKDSPRNEITSWKLFQENVDYSSILETFSPNAGSVLLTHPQKAWFQFNSFSPLPAPQWEPWQRIQTPIKLLYISVWETPPSQMRKLRSPNYNNWAISLLRLHRHNALRLGDFQRLQKMVQI